METVSEIKIRGYVTYIFFPKNGLDPHKLIQFAGFNIKTEQYGNVACYGKVALLETAEYLELTGSFEDNSKTKFQFRTAVRVDDDEIGAAAMILWLFGSKVGSSILEGFQYNSMRALELFKNHRDLFFEEALKIKGVGEKTVQHAMLKYEDHVGIDVIYSSYAEYGMGLKQALKVFSLWGDQSVKKIEENPYALHTECHLPFQLADQIALKKYGVSFTDERRIYASALQALNKAESAGHCYIRLKTPSKVVPGIKDLKTEIKTYLSIENDRYIDEQLERLFKERKLVEGRHKLKQIVCTPEMDEAEFGVAEEVYSRLKTMPYPSGAISQYIEDFEKDHFPLADLQKKAIETSVKNQFSLISGPPGSGKTTIINTIVSMLQSFHPKHKIVMCSPTGKAAQRMKESTGREASTIHRLLEYSPMTKDFIRNENNQLECDILIVDEFSMCGVLLFYKLIRALPKSCHIILVGDHEQLPSIEPGKVLEDLLSFVPKTILTKVYRQAEGSAILKDALAIGQGDVEAIRNFVDANDLFFHEEKEVLTLRKQIVQHFLSAVKEYDVENVCILSPMNKGELGSDLLNRLIQEELHPFTHEEAQISIGKDRCFRLYDRVIQIKNEPEFGVFNGDVGTVIAINKGDRTTGAKDSISVDFGNDLVIEYHRDRFDKLKLAYCLTVHKSQGSEYKNVLLILHSSQQFMLQKKLVYTGWTRAKERLDVFGEKGLIERCISYKEIPRNSRLRKFLLELRANS